MIPEQLDLFGRPPKPPKKILVDEPEPAHKDEVSAEVFENAHDNLQMEPIAESEKELEPAAEGLPVEKSSEILPEINLTSAERQTFIHTEPASTNKDEADPYLKSVSKEVGVAQIPSEDEAGITTTPETSDKSASNDPGNEETDFDFSETQLPPQPSEKAECVKEAISGEQAPVKADRTPFKAEQGSVPADEILFRRQYYSMRETSTMLGISQSLLRFWENEFDVLRPRKNRKGDRYFRPVDIKNLQLIIHLLKVRRFTLDGAREYLRTHNKALDNFELIQKLEKLKSFLHELKAHL